jgi:predicted GTPase
METQGIAEEILLTLCEVCLEDPSTSYCDSNCSKYYCDDCWAHGHKKGESKKHIKMEAIKKMEEELEKKKMEELNLKKDCQVCKNPSKSFCIDCVKYLCNNCWDYLHKDQTKMDHKKLKEQDLKNLENKSKYKVGETILENSTKKEETLKKLKKEANDILSKLEGGTNDALRKKLNEIIQKCDDDLEKSKMLFIGKTSSGKTTLINWLLGEDVGIVKPGKATSFISYYFKQKMNEKGETLIEEMFAGNNCLKSFSASDSKSYSEVYEERKSYIEEYIKKEQNEKETMEIIDHSNIYVKSDLLDYLEIIDSPGLGKEIEEFNDKKTLEIAEKSTVVVYIIGDSFDSIDIKSIQKLIPVMKKNQLVILSNKIDIPMESETNKMTFEEARKERINEISSSIFEFKEPRAQNLIHTISLEKMKKPWENEEKIYETLGNEFKEVFLNFI